MALILGVRITEGEGIGIRRDQTWGRRSRVREAAANHDDECSRTEFVQNSVTAYPPLSSCYRAYNCPCTWALLHRPLPGDCFTCPIPAHTHEHWVCARAPARCSATLGVADMCLLCWTNSFSFLEQFSIVTRTFSFLLLNNSFHDARTFFLLLEQIASPWNNFTPLEQLFFPLEFFSFRGTVPYGLQQFDARAQKFFLRLCQG
jgi:hypothetical protein